MNPTGGAAVGVASSVMVTINASDNAFGVYQFADSSLTVMAQETGDVGYKSVFLKVKACYCVVHEHGGRDSSVVRIPYS